MSGEKKKESGGKKKKKWKRNGGKQGEKEMKEKEKKKKKKYKEEVGKEDPLTKIQTKIVLSTHLHGVSLEVLEILDTFDHLLIIISTIGGAFRSSFGQPLLPQRLVFFVVAFVVEQTSTHATSRSTTFFTVTTTHFSLEGKGKSVKRVAHPDACDQQEHDLLPGHDDAFQPGRER